MGSQNTLKINARPVVLLAGELVPQGSKVHLYHNLLKPRIEELLFNQAVIVKGSINLHEMLEQV
jgi:hypothetical protein